MLAPAWSEPLLLDCHGQDWVVTLWPLARNRLVTSDEMAEMLRCLHDTLLPDSVGVWPGEWFDHLRCCVQALREARPLPPQDVLEGCVSAAEAAMERLEARLAESSARVLVHGAAHPANIVELDGRLVACDLGWLCAGPPEAALVVPLTQSRIYPGADPGAGEALVKAYGRPVDRELLEAAVDLRALYRTVSLGAYISGLTFPAVVVPRPSLHGS